VDHPGSPPERVGNRTDGRIDVFTALMSERPPRDAVGISLALGLTIASLILLLGFGFSVPPE